MTVYVDEIIDYGERALAKGLPSTHWAHLTADTRAELHTVAGRLGLARAWFQDDPVIWHYDVTTNKRHQAIRLGATELDWREMGQLIERRRAQHAIAIARAESAPISATRQWLAAVDLAGGQCQCPAVSKRHHHPKEHTGRCVMRNTINAEPLYLFTDGKVYCAGCFDYQRKEAEKTASVPKIDQCSLF